MSAIAFWSRLDLGRRWRSLLVLALLVAFAAGTVLTAVGGARRGASALDRLLTRTLPATAVVLPNEPGFDWDAIRALPEVEALATFVVTDYQVEGLAHEFYDGQFPPGDGEAMRTIERPVVLEGRLADPDDPHEAVVSPQFAANFDRGVGDSITFRLYTPEQVDAFNEGGFEPATADGPAVEARIVGVVRSPWFGDQVGHSGTVVPSAGLYAAYRPNLVGGNEGGSINALVRLRGGEASIPAFKAGLAEVSGRTDIDVWNSAEFASHLRDVTGYEAKSLVAFALAAGVAAVFLVGQSLARYASASINDLQVLQAMGMTPTEALGASVVGPTMAGLAGVTLGAGGAAVASRWFPIGSASLLEPAPGASLDAAVLVPGATFVAALVATGALTAGWVALRAKGQARSPRCSALASAAARAGLPAPVVVGTRFALEPGRGRQAVPVPRR